MKIVTKEEYEKLIAIEERKLKEEALKGKAKARLRELKRKYKQLKHRKVIRVVKVFGRIAKTTAIGFGRMGKGIAKATPKVIKGIQPLAQRAEEMTRPRELPRKKKRKDYFPF